MEDVLITKPLLPLRDTVVLPGMVVNLDLGRDKSINAAVIAAERDNQLIIVAQRDAAVTDVQPADLYNYGIIAKINQQIPLPNGTVRILVEGLARFRLTDVTEINQNRAYMVGQGLTMDVQREEDAETEALRRMAINAFELWAVASKKVGAEVLQTMKQQEDVDKLADTMASYVPLGIPEKQQLLETPSAKQRLRQLYELLTREKVIAETMNSVASEVRKAVDKNQRDYYLREQIKAISKELGEGEDVLTEINAYKERMAKLTLPADVTEKLNKEMSRLLKMGPMAPEGAVVRAYVETLLSLPWGIMNEDSFDLKRAKEQLDHDHYGLKKVKERILEYLAVRALSRSLKGPILCLVGPPGVGKTSLAHSIADALGRKFTRLSLGGVRDEAEIRGHRRTYLGAIPGRIIHGMQISGCMNPLFLLDEVDKMGADYRGDPASALLEVLDPEQNNTFTDHYIEFPFDLSKVFWIVTANTVETIPPALLDRMEIIQLSSYTDEEKLKIAELHLLPKEIKANGLEDYKVTFSEKALRRIIRDYTREAGVRNLERKIGTACRKVAYRIVEGKSKGAQITDKNLEKYLGPVIFLEEARDLEPAVGVCNGLAWTSVGGELLKVEVLTFKGKGNLTLTGQLGDVMKESAQAGFTYIRSRAQLLGVDEDFADKQDIHIHLPEGAVPKDGPSAGVTMVTAMVSALTGRRVKGKLAMTGEITLSGRVLPVGGIKEKTLAAYRYGVRTVLLPERNVQDLDELPDNIRKQMTFIPVKHLDDVLKLALEDKND